MCKGSEWEGLHPQRAESRAQAQWKAVTESGVGDGNLALGEP